MNKASYNFIVANVESRKEIWEGDEYLVVPVIAMVEGVHHGSGGPMYYPADEIAKFTEAWNGRPLPVFHPEVNGVPISCNDPEVIAAQSVGHTFNFRYEDGKLKGEAWIKVAKAQEIAPEILSIIKAHGQLEVSTGLFSDTENVPGDWNGEAYDAVMRNFRPDHLALLPGSTGACSWSDGCGVRANEGKERGMETNEDKVSKIREMWKSFKTFFTMEDSFEEKRQALQTVVDAMDNSNWVHYVKAVYSRYFVYQAQPTNPSAGSTAKLWKQDYTLSSSGEVTLGESPVEVKEVVDYKPVNNETNNNQTKGDNMDGKKCCEEQVQLLIENEASKFDETDREWLEGLSEASIAKLMPEEKTDVQKIADAAAADIAAGKLPQDVTDETAVDNEGDADADENKPQTAEEFISNAPAEMQGMLKSGLAMHNANKDRLVSSILANKANQFTKDELDVMDVDQLERMAALAGTKKDFTLNSGGGNNPAADKVEVLEVPKFEDYQKPLNA